MSAGPVLLQSLGNGVIFFVASAGSPAVPVLNHSVYVIARATPAGQETNPAYQVTVYATSALSVPLTQPLSTGSNGAGPGGIPGWVAGEQSIDLYDATTGQRTSAEPVAASTVVSVGSTGQIPARQIPSMRPWLGLNANHAASGAFGGGQQIFSNLGIVYTRESQVQGQANDGSGNVLATDLATIASVGQIPVVILSASTYQSGAYITGAAITSYAAWFVTQVQAIEAAHPTLGTLYEIDNEPWNFYTPAATAAQYADVVVAVLNAAQTAGLDLTRIFAMIHDNNWVQAMYAEQSTLQTLVQGWSIHPYGPPPPGFASNGQGIASVPAIRQTITGSGADNILISEIGISDQTISNTPGGGNSSAATSAQAQQWVADILEAAAGFHAAGWLRALLLYHRSAGNDAMVVVNSFSSPFNLNNGTLTGAGTALVNFAQRMRPTSNQSYAPRTPGIWLPYDDGLFAATMDPAAAKDAVQIVAGKIHFFRVRVDVYDFVNHLTVWVDTAGATLTASECFVGVYQQQLASGAGAYVSTGVTADQSGNWTSPGRKMVSLTGGSSFVPGYYWIAILGNGTTMPKFRGVLVGDQLNIGNFGALPQRVMQSVSTFTSLPSSLDLSSGSVVSGSAFASGVLAALN